MNARNGLIAFICGCTIGYLLVLGRFAQAEYIKLLLIFPSYFFAGWFIEHYTPKFNLITFLFLFPGLFFIIYGVFENPSAIYIWITEFLVIVTSFTWGFFTAKTKSPRFRILSSLFAAGTVLIFAFIINPQILFRTEFPEVSTMTKKFGGSFMTYNFTDRLGKKIDEEQLNNKVVLLDFWFIGCGPCYRKMNAIGELAEHFKGRNDVVFMTVDVEHRDKFDEFLTETGLFPKNLTHVYDSGANVAKKYDLTGFPTEFLIDKSGKLRSVFVGYNKDFALVYVDNTIKKIEELLKE